MENIKKISQIKVGTKDNVIVTICDTSSSKAKKMEKAIVILKRKNAHYKYKKCMLDNMIKIRETIEEFHKLFAVRKYASSNLVPTIGRRSIARRLANDTTDTLIVNYGALGSDCTPADNGDTVLGTEVYRNEIASRTFSNNLAYLTFFYTATEDDGTYEEFGMFIDGTGAADSGVMFNHNIAQWVKSNSESLTVDIIITVS